MFFRGFWGFFGFILRYWGKYGDFGVVLAFKLCYCGFMCVFGDFGCFWAFVLCLGILCLL